MPTTGPTRAAFVLLLSVAAWGFFYGLGAIPLLDDPNEAQYAEVAREIVESGDWLSPHLNYALFLNKPPLAYWLIALADSAFGINEFAARLPSALAGLAIVALVVWLGALLFDPQTGLLAGAVLLATGGFFVETHEVRPDLLLTASVIGSLVASAYVLRLRDGTAGRDRRATTVCEPHAAATHWPLLGLQACLAAGLLAKGLAALFVPACVIAVLVVTERRSGVRTLFHPKRWWLFLLLIAPWHVLMSLRHPGFVWDYVVHQHVLFFFDQKVPRDSVPVPLAVFWGALALRLFPWTLFAPLAIVAAVRRAWRAPDAAGDRLLLAWAAATLVLFSAAPSRMEHYSLPAVPAFPLLMAKMFRDYARGAGAVAPRVVTGHVLALAALALAGPFLVPRLVAAQEWLAPVRELPALAQAVFALVAAGAALAACAAVAGYRAWVPLIIVAMFVVTIPSFHHGLSLLARVDSSAGLAAEVQRINTPGGEVVYAAPIEYQSGAGLNFYLRRKLAMVRPVGFVAPRYLEPHLDELFINRSDLERMWRHEPVILITDRETVHDGLTGADAPPVHVVARDHARQVLSNHPAVGDRGAQPAVPAGLP